MAAELTVTAPYFAFALTQANESKMLHRGDVIDPVDFQQDSIDHLVEIGFLSKPARANAKPADNK